MTDLVDVIEVQIKAPHKIWVMESGLTEKDAEAYIKMAIMRRGVKDQFYKAAPVRQYRDGDTLPQS